MKKEMQNPINFQPNEKFVKFAKFATIICNKNYNKKYITLDDLPAVGDDCKNAKHTCRIMGILSENTFILNDASFNVLEHHFNWLCSRIGALTKVLDGTTGILGIGFMQNGLLWETLRTSAMKLVFPFTFIVIDLNAKEQQILKDLIDL